MRLLKFNFGNAKLNERIAILNLPAGWACPMALHCLSKANRQTGKLIEKPDIWFRCFGAVGERFPAVRALRWYNFELLTACKDLQEMVNLITASLPSTKYVRPHSDGGDFFKEEYFLAWFNVAINHPDRVFYTYTKRPDFIIKYRDRMPANFRLTASYGGKLDHLIAEHKLKSARVFYSEEAAHAAGLEIDKDDSHAIDPNKGDFALLLHSHQPKGTDAAKAWYKIMKAGKGYSGKNRRPAPSIVVGEPKITVGLDN